MKNNWHLYVLILIPFIYVILFRYIPIYGSQIAFRKFTVSKGLYGSDWVGLDNFIRFFNSYDFKTVIGNTVQIAALNLLIAFPAPIIFALSLNYIKGTMFKKTIQMLTYAPHFISVVVVAAIIMQLLSTNTGMINNLLKIIIGEKINFMSEPAYFKYIYVLSGIWQNIGYGSIIYIAALSGIDPALHEAGVVDGASKLKRIINIDMPGIIPTVIVLFILEVGKFLNVGFQKILLLQNLLNLPASEVIDTYIYRVGIISGLPDYSYAAAIGIFKSVIGLILILIANKVSNKVNGSGIW